MNMYKVSIRYTKNKTFDFNSLYPDDQKINLILIIILTIFEFSIETKVA